MKVSLNEDHFKQTICESAVAQKMASAYAMRYVSQLMLGFVYVAEVLEQGGGLSATDKEGTMHQKPLIYAIVGFFEYVHLCVTHSHTFDIKQAPNGKPASCVRCWIRLRRPKVP